MLVKREILSNVQSESVLLGILRLIGLLCLYKDVDKKRGRPYVYPTVVMIRCYVVRVWMRIPSNNCLHQYFSIGIQYNKRVMMACGLHALPDRRTFDRRFKVLPTRQIIAKMGQIFLLEGLVDDTTASVDSSLLKAMGPVWHKSSMKKKILPIPGIDTDARWGFSKARGWVFGYKLHMSCSTGRLAVPLSAGITTANVFDPHRYGILIESIAGMISHVVADSIYSTKETYDSSSNKRIVLVCPIGRESFCRCMLVWREIGYNWKQNKCKGTPHVSYHFGQIPFVFIVDM
ncbi:MAG: transposase [Thaumarchaeota archaeon]|nr:transposase [Nitrososphaerota archaeon]MDE1832073.1 transposase [Nitrososphaerota archaeon]MDE1840354.1 transposase [Nitrososphaerota archaeon]MDE1878277.1 transposase [Nitrososphaerota archaeon]